MIKYEELLPSSWTGMAKMYSALGDEHRQKILLMFKHKKELNVTEIAECNPLTRSAVAHHLKILHDAHILNRRKDGKEVYYSINVEMLSATLNNTLAYLETISS